MVQFQPDNDSLTTGNGQFLMSQGTGLDAPPHDKAYFENHLLFLKNYYAKVSGGKFSVVDSVLDSIITLPHQTKYYSPPETGAAGADNLGLLYQDAWHAADSIYKNFDFGQFDCFVIFHAGSGRDIDFTTTLGYDPRPYDIPSIYLSMQSLRAMFGANYNGEPADSGNFIIPNSIILPESEAYQIYDGTGSLIFSLTLGTNGLLAASFGSFLGLPDLFDTQTGVTGIGRFGLMDGQSIFAFGGIFPPEPSAWEKARLAWRTPIVVAPPTATQFQLYANETGKDSTLEIPINGTEYFLLENREGDAHHDGENITVAYEGSSNIISMNFVSDTAYFDGQQIKGINGVVTDADEYDWALPQDTTYFGGILIWHIDQSVIDQNIATNTINANPDHRGVALMEAHGANEIGRYIQTIFGSYYYDGAFTDFWYKGNPDRSQSQNVGGNQFTPTSLPNSDSYSGANSHVYITNFSNHDSVMTFDVTADSIAPNFQVTAGFPKNIRGATLNSSPVFGHISADGKLQVIANNGDSLYAFNMDGTSAGFDSMGFFSKVGGKFQPVVSSAPFSDTVFAMDGSVFYGLADRDNNNDGTADTIFPTKSLSSVYQIAEPMLMMGSKILAFANYPAAWSVFTSSGKYVGSYSLPLPGESNTTSPVVTGASSILPQFAAADTSNVYLNVEGHGVYSINLDNVIQSPSSTPPYGTIAGSAPPVIAVSYASLSSSAQPEIVELTPQSVYIDSAGSTPRKICSVFPGDTITSGPVFADLEGDGHRDIIFAAGTKVYAISYTGATLNHFPISTVGSEVLPSDANQIVGSIAVADLDDDGKPEVIFGTKGGTIYAFTGATGGLFPGFPLSVSGGLAGSPAVAYDPSGNLYLAAIGLDGYLYCWTFKGASPNQVFWGNLLHDNFHMNSVTEPLQTQPPPAVQSLMPTSQVYNWPNPVTNGLTKVHFYLRDNARVSISIFSFAGDKVADIQANGTGGMANEVDWNASGVQSGVYFARVEAVSSKERDVAIIKIAVVK